MNTPCSTGPNEPPPDFQYPIPSRPEFHKQDAVSLIRLVYFYHQMWEIYITEDGIWTAQGRTDSNLWARFEADTAAHLEEMIKGV